MSRREPGLPHSDGSGSLISQLRSLAFIQHRDLGGIWNRLATGNPKRWSRARPAGLPRWTSWT
ncbi:MAG: hypothetical protein ACREN8_13200, partial [Candidatus Dormibacteraceae bacterium]